MIPESLIPADPRHQRFADRLLRGDSLVDAYMAAGFKCKRTSALQNAKRLRDQPHVQAYVRAIQQGAADDTVMSLLEKRQFLARIKRVPIDHIDYDTGKNTDLIKKYKVRKSELGSSTELEKYDATAAIKIDNLLSGDDPESNAVGALAEAIASLAAKNPLPDDKM